MDRQRANGNPLIMIDTASPMIVRASKDSSLPCTVSIWNIHVWAYHYPLVFDKLVAFELYHSPFPAPLGAVFRSSCIKAFFMLSSTLPQSNNIEHFGPTTLSTSNYLILTSPQLLRTSHRQHLPSTHQGENPRHHPHPHGSGHRGSSSYRLIHQCLHRHLLRRVPRAMVRSAQERHRGLQDQQYRHFLRWGLCQWRLCLKDCYHSKIFDSEKVYWYMTDCSKDTRAMGRMEGARCAVVMVCRSKCKIDLSSIYTKNSSQLQRRDSQLQYRQTTITTSAILNSTVSVVERAALGHVLHYIAV
jgi:hypothetical protein